MINNALLIICPHCQSLHAYELVVHRVALPEGKSLYYKQPENSRFTLTFPCPEKQTTFESSLGFVEFPGLKIESVVLKGLVDLEGE